MNQDFIPTIKVTSFKESGKYYSEHTSALKPAHLEIYGFELSDRIKKNLPEVQDYSGLIGGFDHSFYYVVEVDYGPKQDFCFFHMNGIKNG